MFDTYVLQPFDEEQVERYVSYWFDLNTDITSQDKSRMISSFIGESQVVSDLRSNPLMLGLMCNIYRGENYIPQNRPAVYEKCAIMLFERWDKSRNIRVKLAFEALIRPAMMHLAYWMYANPKIAGGVTEYNLIEETTRYLLTKRYDDEDEARDAAMDFIEFCRGRAWVFTQTGSTATEGLYEFTHRTFLEYFTACYIVRTHKSPDALFITLYPRIQRQEWDVVSQLAFQIMCRDDEDATEILLDMLLKGVEESVVHRDSALLFLVRTLEFLTPKISTIKAIVEKVLHICFSSHLRLHRRKNCLPRLEFAGKQSEILFALLNCSEDNLEFVTRHLSAVLESMVQEPDREQSTKVALLELATHLYLLQGNDFRRFNDSRRHYWKSVSADLLLKHVVLLRSLATKHYPFAKMLLTAGEWNIAEVLRHYPLKIIAADFTMGHFQGRFISVIEHVIAEVERDKGPIQNPMREHVLNAAEQLASPLMYAKLPWCPYSFLATRKLEWSYEPKSDEQTVTYDYSRRGNLLFSAFVMIASICDSLTQNTLAADDNDAPSYTRNDYIASLTKSQSVMINHVLRLIQSGDSSQLPEWIDNWFDAKQKQFVLDWVDGKMQLVSLRKRKKVAGVEKLSEIG